jgi:hypothetical protein
MKFDFKKQDIIVEMSISKYVFTPIDVKIENNDYWVSKGVILPFIDVNYTHFILLFMKLFSKI